ncbi:Glycogen synthase [Rubripirellula obstinata]|uniref:Glycogen synthase n=1 Tax=Rubripirellula obstinata TaxID=406547 RepID=A0A5B1CJA2_9BACT|nr:glycosyltransferase family 4 protein [Rubripirellula obstinata]KAA1261178.1 Glycogen synthase [Rubripirellula obstinata]
MKIGIIGHLKHPIAKPFAGGLEAFTHSFVRYLINRGHDVTLFASGDSDSTLPITPIVQRATVNESRRRLGHVHHEWIEKVEDDSYADLFVGLGNQDFDVIHNHSLSPIPLRFASVLPTPMLTTLHAPPLPRMLEELTNRADTQCGNFVNISHANAGAWRPYVSEQTVVYNGIDTQFWNSGCQKPRPQKPGQQNSSQQNSRQRRAICFGRILPDKGTHMALDAARLAGLPIDIVGPIADAEYFNQQIVPRLNQQASYLGHKDHGQLCELIGRASVAMVTPCWDEPFGLVVTEALACGTPVAGFARGALPEIIDDSTGRLAEPGNIHALADATKQCVSVSALQCRHVAQRRFGWDQMVDQYELLYRNSQVEVAA